MYRSRCNYVPTRGWPLNLRTHVCDDATSPRAHAEREGDLPPPRTTGPLLDRRWHGWFGGGGVSETRSHPRRRRLRSAIEAEMATEIHRVMHTAEERLTARERLRFGRERLTGVRNGASGLSRVADGFAPRPGKETKVKGHGVGLNYQPAGLHV